MKFTFLYIVLFIVSSIYGQNDTNDEQRIMTMSYDSLFNKINSSNTEKKSFLYADIFLKKAKKDGNTDYIVWGYENIAALKDGLESIPYLDSIIDLTSKKPNNFHPCSAYLSKGSYYYRSLKNKEALKNFLIAEEYSIQNPNERLEAQIRHSIGMLKNRIGDYKSTLELHNKNLDFYGKNIDEYSVDNYLNSLFSVSLVNLKLGNLDSAKKANLKGLKFSKTYNRGLHLNLFKLSQSVLNYNQKKYKMSLDTLKSIAPIFKKYKNLTNLSITYNYIAENYIRMDDNRQALKYLLKVDSLYVNEHIMVLEIRNAYRHLFRYYEDVNDDKNQLKYLREKIRVDSVLYLNKEISDNISLEFDIPRLVAKRDKLIRSFEKRNSKLIYSIVLLAVVAFSLLFALLLNRHRMKKRFDNILLELEDGQKLLNKKINKYDDTQLSEEIVTQILTELKKFENSHGYIDQQLTLTKLSKKINSNSSYVSKVINLHKGQNFSGYIKELRICFAMDRLKKEPSFRKYTISAISLEVGFKSAETFSKFFKSYTGLYPSYFIKQLEKSQKEVFKES
ncbi:helix-turn-helix domain-containing protein [Cellulophaga lytica]|nr:helix-turn-helix domain-containing protein [Cellulophaga lytica]